MTFPWIGKNGECPPHGWEQSLDVATCSHIWTIAEHPRTSEHMAVCSMCGAPRCVSDSDAGRCTRVMHHRLDHRYPDGSKLAVGGTYRPPGEFGDPRRTQ